MLNPQSDKSTNDNDLSSITSKAIEFDQQKQSLKQDETQAIKHFIKNDKQGFNQSQYEGWYSVDTILYLMNSQQDFIELGSTKMLGKQH